MLFHFLACLIKLSKTTAQTAVSIGFKKQVSPHQATPSLLVITLALLSTLLVGNPDPSSPIHELKLLMHLPSHYFLNHQPKSTTYNHSCHSRPPSTHLSATSNIPSILLATISGILSTLLAATSEERPTVAAAMTVSFLHNAPQLTWAPRF